MDYTPLSDAEVAALSDAESTFEASRRRLRRVQESIQTGIGALHPDMAQFQACVRLKLTVDLYEDISLSHPSHAVLSVFLNCEYQIRRLYEGDPLRVHPFLSHWVEAIARLDHGSHERHIRRPARYHTQDDRQATSEEITGVRLRFLKHMLEFGGEELASRTPKSLLDDGSWSSSNNFELERYTRMLVEEGVYDAPDGTSLEGDNVTGDSATEPAGLPKNNPSTGPPAEESDLSNGWQEIRRQEEFAPPGQNCHWIDSLRSKLEASRGDALAELSRFPIDVSHLDLLTRIVQSNLLEEYSIQAAELICNFLGHALRTVEQMGERAVGTPADASTPEPDELPRGPDAQKAALQKLILFITNLIRKGLVPRETLVYDAQEIWTRYAWIKDVRDFKIFFEFGDAGVAGGG